MLQKYYEILGVNQNYTLNELKFAYRSKAKQFHPDINKAPDANSKFIEINEAYIILNQLKQDQSTAQKSNTNISWYKEEKERAKKRAAYYAKMKYEEYKKSPIYKAAKVIDPILKTIIIGFSIFIFIAPIIFITYRKLNNLTVIPLNFVYLFGAIIIGFFVVRTILKELKYY